MSVRSYPPGSAYPPVQDDLDPTLQALADLPTNADTAPYFTDVDQMALMTVTPLARSLLDDTTQAEMRVTLGISDTPAAPTGTPGTVAYFGASGTLTSENALSYDSVNNRIGINTTTPSTSLDVNGRVSVGGTATYPASTASALQVWNSTYPGVTLTGNSNDEFVGLAGGLAFHPGGFAASRGLERSVHAMIATLALQGSGSIGHSSGLEVRLRQEGTATFESYGVHVTATGSGTGSGTYYGLVVRDPTWPNTLGATGIFSDISAGTGRYNLNIRGTAYNYLQGNLGIGEEPVHHLNVAGYGKLAGIGLGGAEPQSTWALYTGGSWWSYFGARVGIGTTPNHMLHVQGDVGFGTTLLVQGATTLNGGLYAPGNAQLGRTGIAYAPDANYWLRSGSAYFDAINCGGKIVGASLGYGWDPPRWPLDINGHGHVLQLGVYYGPPGAVWFRTASAAFDSVQVGRGDAAARWALDCSALGHVLQLGVHYGADVAVTDGVHLRCTDVKFDNLGVGYNPNGAYSIRAGATYVDNFTSAGNSNLVGLVGIGGNAVAGWNLYGYGVGYYANFHSTYMGAGTREVAGYGLRASNIWCDNIGAGYAGGQGYSVRASTAWFDHIAVNEAPVGGWYITTYNLLTRANAQISTSLYVGGTSQFSGTCGFGYAPHPSYWIRAGACNLDSVTTGGLTTGGGVTIGTDLVVGNWAGKPGGGLWADTSSRAMKKAIAPIDGALALLLAQQGRQYEWTEPHHRAVLPGMRYGLVLEEVTIPQWVVKRPGEQPLLSVQGFEALTIEGLREIVQRLERLEQKETR